MLFWMGTGAAAFAPIEDATRLYHRLEEAFERGVDAVGRIINAYNEAGPDEHQFRLLHLSDLHFGTDTALQRQGYLLTEVQRIKGSYDRVVITGDLINTPNRHAYHQFENFLTEVRMLTPEAPVVVTGNHDMRRLGNSVGPVWRDVSQLVSLNLHVNRHVTDAKARCVFFCFNSSEGGDFARGRISDDQMLKVGTAYQAEAVASPEIESYLRVAVVHHHPYPYQQGVERRPVSRWRRLGGVDDMFVAMEEADRFVGWCARLSVPLVLHGHKHEAH
jgi:Icc-related predicted phosphoesterase